MLTKLKGDGDIYVPFYDNNGNITRYLDANGNTVAQYTYDAFGNTISQSGPLASFFRHRFSTKYFDPETGLYYYGYRFYHPQIMRWINRDPIEESGGNNLYLFCGNTPVNGIDILGMVEYRGRNTEKDFYYDFKINKCEVEIIYGHGHESKPHKVAFEDTRSSSAYFWGCWPDTTNRTIPTKSRLVEEIGPHRTFYDDSVFEQLKALREKALQRAKVICETRCCKEGVWIRYQFSPSENFGGRVWDWLKGNTSRNKPSQLVGGGVWEGDTHVKCH